METCLIRKNVKVALKDNGSFLWFEVYKKVGREWVSVEGSLSSTNIPSDIELDDKIRALEYLLGAVYFDVANGQPTIKALCEHLSGLRPELLGVVMKKSADAKTEESAFIFTVTLKGTGANIDEAWRNAVDAFAAEPGCPPEDYTVEYDGVIETADGVFAG